MLVVLVKHTREIITLEVSGKLKSHDVIKVLSELTALRGKPENNRSGNGGGLITNVITDWTRKADSTRCRSPQACPGKS